MFGEGRRQRRKTKMTPFHPRSAYGISKVAGFDLTRNYREAYGMFASSGILFNHDALAAGLNLSRGRSRRTSPGSSLVWPMSFGWEISRPNATGATPANTCGPCG